MFDEGGVEAEAEQTGAASPCRDNKVLMSARVLPCGNRPSHSPTAACLPDSSYEQSYEESYEESYEQSYEESGSGSSSDIDSDSGGDTFEAVMARERLGAAAAAADANLTATVADATAADATADASAADATADATAADATAADATADATAADATAADAAAAAAADAAAAPVAAAEEQQEVLLQFRALLHTRWGHTVQTQVRLVVRGQEEVLVWRAPAPPPAPLASMSASAADAGAGANTEAEGETADVGIERHERAQTQTLGCDMRFVTSVVAEAGRAAPAIRRAAAVGTAIDSHSETHYIDSEVCADTDAPTPAGSGSGRHYRHYRLLRLKFCGLVEGHAAGDAFANALELVLQPLEASTASGPVKATILDTLCNSLLRCAALRKPQTPMDLLK